MSVTALTAEDIRWLVCPVCKHPLTLEAVFEAESQTPSASEAVRCTGCQRRYPIVDGIPVLLASRAF